METDLCCWLEKAATWSLLREDPPKDSCQFCYVYSTNAAVRFCLVGNNPSARVHAMGPILQGLNEAARVSTEFSARLPFLVLSSSLELIIIRIMNSSYIALFLLCQQDSLCCTLAHAHATTHPSYILKQTSFIQHFSPPPPPLPPRLEIPSHLHDPPPTPTHVKTVKVQDIKD